MHVIVQQLYAVLGLYDVNVMLCMCRPKQRARSEEQLYEHGELFDKIVARGNYKIEIMGYYKIRTYPIFKLFLCFCQ